jgi:hypothetical protein
VPAASRFDEIVLVALAVTGLAFWFVIGLPWGPHNETFDWIVRLEQRSFWGALFEKFPSVLSLRPLGTGPAWVLYRLGGHDVGLAQFVNAALALLAWGWVARGVPQPRLFAVMAMVVGAVYFAGYIWVFHLHGIFYGPLLVFVAALIRSARGPIDLRTLLGVFVGGVLTALAHPYALPLVLAFALGALLETAALRTREGVAVLAVIVTGSLAAYLLLVPGYNRGITGDPVAGLLASYRMTEVNGIGTRIAIVLAMATASLAWTGRGSWIAALVTGAIGFAAAASGMPVMPLWLAWAALKSVRHGRWTMAALVAASALLPLANPTGSPTYAIFAVFAALAATTLDQPANEARLARIASGAWPAAIAVLLAVALAVRAGWPVPIVSGLARPLLAEGERTRQIEVLAARLMDSKWRQDPVRFATDTAMPVDVATIDRRFRPPTERSHLTTWLDWKRGGPAAGLDTLVMAFGGDTRPGMDTLFVAHGRYAGDALVLRRSSAVQGAD